MASNINYTNIDENYPVAGQDNDSQGFRDNFQNIKTALNTAATEITSLQGDTPSLTSENDFTDKKLKKAIFEDTAWSAPSAETISTETNVDYTAGHYRRLILTAEKTDSNNVVITNWAPSESAGHMILEVRSNNSNQKFFKVISSSGSVLTDTSNVDFSGSGFDLTDASAKYVFQVWSPDQGANVFVYYLGAFK
jgi:hypothetical protein